MEVRIDSLLAGAKKAEGTVVIIDVYRAFTTACIAVEQGAEKIVLTPEIDDALLLRRQKVGDLCVGEVDGRKPEDFDHGNSPYEISQADLTGKTPILSTRAGTVGANAAWHAGRMYGASLVNASATARVIRAEAPSLVTVVAMGLSGRIRTDEDEICAIYLKNLLLGLHPPRQAVADLIASSHESLKFDDPAQPHFHPRDRDLALDIDRSPFALSLYRRDRVLVAVPIAAPPEEPLDEPS
jgi:2-phosphosulfolactate phosphatase